MERKGPTPAEKHRAFKMARGYEQGLRRGTTSLEKMQEINKGRRRILRELNEQINSMPRGPERDQLIERRRELEVAKYASRIAESTGGIFVVRD